MSLYLLMMCAIVRLNAIFVFSFITAFFFFNDTATTEIYTLSLHDALPIYPARSDSSWRWPPSTPAAAPTICVVRRWRPRSEEHTSELQSHSDLVCRLLLEKKKKIMISFQSS